MKILFRIIAVAGILLGLSVLIYTLVYGYEAVLGQLIAAREGVNSPQRLAMIFSPSRFRIIQAAAGSSVLLFALLFYKAEALSKLICTFLADLWSSLKGLWKDVKSVKFLLVFSIPAVFLVYLALTKMAHIDEAFTYLNFANDMPFYYPMATYPAPNNHVLNSVLLNITKHIPLFDILFRIRIPALLASFLTMAIGYSFVKRHFSEKVAMIVVVLFSIQFYTLLYGFLSRGYAMNTLFTVICLYAAFNIIRNGSQRKHWIYFIVGGILGFYTVPSFLYPFFTINLIILIYNYKNIKQQFIAGLTVVAGVLLLYSPILLVEGIDALANNQFVAPQDRMTIIEKLPEFLAESLEAITGWPWFVMVALIIVGIAVSIRNKDYKLLSLWAVFILVPIVITIVHSVIPFARVYSYYAFVLALLIATSFAPYINKISVKILAIAALVLQAGSIWVFNYNFVHKDEGMIISNSFNDICEEYVKENINDKYYIISWVGYINLKFYLANEGRSSESKNFIYKVMQDSSPFKMNTDTINGYDYIIIDTDRDATAHSKPLEKNDYWTIYQKKYTTTNE